MEFLQAWKNWREGTTVNIIDPTLSSGSITEMIRCIHIGLLCVQENVASRPTMASVVLMLNSYSLTLPVPSEPAFFMDSIIESDMSSSLAHDSRITETDHPGCENLPLSGNNEISITDLYPRWYCELASFLSFLIYSYYCLLWEDHPSILSIPICFLKLSSFIWISFSLLLHKLNIIDNE